MVKIDGEMAVGGFVASKNSIKYWEVPESNEIDEETKKIIIEKVSPRNQRLSFGDYV